MWNDSRFDNKIAFNWMKKKGNKKGKSVFSQFQVGKLKIKKNNEKYEQD